MIYEPLEQVIVEVVKEATGNAIHIVQSYQPVFASEGIDHPCSFFMVSTEVVGSPSIRYIDTPINKGRLLKQQTIATYQFSSCYAGVAEWVRAAICIRHHQFRAAGYSILNPRTTQVLQLRDESNNWCTYHTFDVSFIVPIDLLDKQPTIDSTDIKAVAV